MSKNKISMSIIQAIVGSAVAQLISSPTIGGFGEFGIWNPGQYNGNSPTLIATAFAGNGGNGSVTQSGSCLLFFVATSPPHGSLSDPSVDVVSVSFQTVGLTRLDSVTISQSSGNGGELRLTAYGLLNPPLSTDNTIQLVLSAGNVEYYAAAETVYTSVSSIGAVVTASNTSTSPSVTVPSTLGNLVANGMALYNQNVLATATVGTGQTLDGFSNTIGAQNTLVAERSSQSTSTDVGWSLNGSAAWTEIGIELQK